MSRGTPHDLLVRERPTELPARRDVARASSRARVPSVAAAPTPMRKASSVSIARRKPGRRRRSAPVRHARSAQRDLADRVGDAHRDSLRTLRPASSLDENAVIPPSLRRSAFAKHDDVIGDRTFEMSVLSPSRISRRPSRRAVVRRLGVAAGLGLRQAERGARAPDKMSGKNDLLLFVGAASATGYEPSPDREDASAIGATRRAPRDERSRGRQVRRVVGLAARRAASASGRGAGRATPGAHRARDRSPS